MKTGLFPCMSDEYRQAEGVNISLLVEGVKSMAHLKWAKDHPEETTPTLQFGIAVHFAVYEPDSLRKHVIVGLKHDRRSNENKAAWAKFEEEHKKKVILKQDEWDQMILIRDSIWRNPVAKEILSAPGQNECAILWQDKETGLACKGRLDRFCKWRGQSFVTDLKTTISAQRDDFQRQIYNLNYHVKSAWYLDGLNAIAPAQRRWAFIAVDKDPPYCNALYELDDDAFKEGRKQYRRLLRQYAECIKTNEWPGFPCDIQPISLPKWAFKREEWQ